jgi:hypothetical protein
VKYGARFLQYHDNLGLAKTLVFGRWPQALCIAKVNDIKLCRRLLTWAGAVDVGRPKGVDEGSFTFLTGLAAAASLLRHDGREVRTRHPTAAAGLSLNEHETFVLCVDSDNGCFGQLE